jgi:hypothetical protein
MHLSKTNEKEWKLNDRNYNSYPIDYNENTKWIFNKLKNFFETDTGIKIIKTKKQIHLHKFVKGDWFGKHNDIRDNRLYTIGVLLNDDFEGGDFRLYDTSEIKLNKIIGNAYIFDVGIQHEITPIINGERYSLLWFLQNEHIEIKRNKLL